MDFIRENVRASKKVFSLVHADAWMQATIAAVFFDDGSEHRGSRACPARSR
ncbi:MAG: hypothetical protein ABJB12_09215 [Pseudomonadota bacterium]